MQPTEELLHRVAPSNPYIRFEPDEVEQSIAARFEQQARRWPTNIAVKSAQHELTYAALNRAANQLAHLILQEQGSGAEPVGLLIEHGAPMVTALLAVLKAGKFYVPLDPTYSRERLAYIIDDAQVGIVLTSDALIGVASDLVGSNLRVLSVDAVASSDSTENPELLIAPEAFSYLLYTSGSTGRPKGVMENHRNVMHFTMVRTNSCHIAPEDRLSLLLTFSFSGSATPLFAALLNGAALHLAYVRETGLTNLARWLVAEEISVCFAGASTFRELVSTLNGSERFPRLRLIRVGGEPVYRHDVELFRKHFPRGCLLLNSIGSSEMKNFAEYFIDHDTVIEDNLVPVGYPVEDTEILLLDDDGRAVGLGEIGEIVVKSRFIAPCYWRRPELTQATFQPAPGGRDERLYRTGDLGCQRPDGALVHLGRKDFQVKIRGYRVEIGEIENALLALAGVSAAVVVAREDQPGDRRLVAYVVISGGGGPQIGAWRAALATKLPGYMIPAFFVVLKSLPATTAGKVDRAKLPQPDRDRPVLETPYMEPCSQLEQVLATFWAEVLGLDRVGMQDDFNALGGDSLRGARLLTTITAVFGVDLPFELLLRDAATVAGMARAIETVRSRAAADERRANGSRAARLTTENGIAGSDEPAATATGQLIIQQTDPIAARSGLTPIAEILGKQLDYVWTWKGKRSTPESFIVTLNDSGKRQGLFWCLQGHRELDQLAGHLGSDQPVHGMRSGHLVMEYTDENVDAIAVHYAAEMITLQPDGPFLLGGNCQGGKIARIIAMRLRELGRTVSLLILMEQGSFPPYDGPVTLIFGRDSHLNPYKLSADSEAVFRSSYPAGYTVDLIAGAHGQFFESPNVETLASALKQRLPDPSEARHPHASLVS